jgi:hypothetical protein
MATTDVELQSIRSSSRYDAQQSGPGDPNDSASSWALMSKVFRRTPFPNPDNGYTTRHLNKLAQPLPVKPIFSRGARTIVLLRLLRQLSYQGYGIFWISSFIIVYSLIIGASGIVQSASTLWVVVYLPVILLVPLVLAPMMNIYAIAGIPMPPLKQLFSLSRWPQCIWVGVHSQHIHGAAADLKIGNACGYGHGPTQVGQALVERVSSTC